MPMIFIDSYSASSINTDKTEDIQYLLDKGKIILTSRLKNEYFT